jgi:hypothetical protein
MSTATAPRPTQAREQQASDFTDLINRPTGFDRPELLQMKMENETIMTECRLHPRNFDTIKRDLLEQLQAFPELATDAIYEKPVGKDQQSGEQKYVRGLSIRAAEALAEAYGYNRIRSDVSELDGDKVKVEATFTDYQKGRVWQDAGILSKTYKDRYGKPARWNDDRFYNVVVKAEVSKRVREVIMRSVNTGLKAWFESECEKISAGLLDDKTVGKIVDQYATKQVTVEMLEKLVGRPRSMGWMQNDRARLLNIWNAIKDGETSIDEVFGDKPTKPLPDPKRESPNIDPVKSEETATGLASEADTAFLDAEGISDVEAIRVSLAKRATTDAEREMLLAKASARADQIRAAKKK